MSPRPAPRSSRPASVPGWDQATFRCGLCGARRTASTETEYVRVVSAHRDAHAVFDKLNAIERDGMGSILRVLLEDVALSTELLALIDQDAPKPQAGTPDPRSRRPS
ncbi:hypothetical protein C5L38_34250 (plasmid) [Streptomyces sp. WAC00288]|uniref:hypothetical protein n=1 Tax=unclassified Streptomyces TaxID=2593676 RepID=UPI000789A0C9|nr:MULTISPECIES: hypothetical protein [unclassified Streptomyces]AVI00126.1 hypothetical protein C5L38_34250 [Streptomyces sp. WAC00288]KYG51187.1 hypothetical protein AWI43_32665 [Streptomyces sp. WAC04657]